LTNAIDAQFDRLRRSGRKAFIPFLPAGDPDISATARLLRELADAGAHVIEVGFPFSDPVADGPVIQAAYTRALARGLRLADVFDCLRQVTHAPDWPGTPLVGMASFSLVHRRGLTAFLDDARDAGLSGLILPDLPAEEAGAVSVECAARGLKLILLVTPTSSDDRAARIAKLTTGFLYCVSVAGITGERDRLPEELLGRLRWLRTQTDVPLCVGFGVGRPEHVAMLREAADGVIVGSALVRRLEPAATHGLDAVAADVRQLVTSLTAALNPTESPARG
jgi:tryptophan synthase alpha chain